jgi:UPF0271 protein
MIKLNCDMGEGMAYDRQIMPLVDMTNLACGFHAGSPELMRENILLAQQYGVEIGAHPSYPDREHFGRVSMELSTPELTALLQYQIGGLHALCRANGSKVSYVKPHGALYNDMMRDTALFEQIIRAVATCSIDLKVMILSSSRNSEYAEIAASYGVSLLYELFADRHYTDEGALVPRSHPQAVLEDVKEIIERMRHYLSYGELTSINGKSLKLAGDSLCVHGDNEAALAVIVSLRDVLRASC